MANGISIPLIVDPKGAIAGLGQAADASGKTASVLKGLGNVAGAAVAALGTAAVGAAAGLVAATKSAGAYAEGVQLAASKTHLSTDAVQELQYASKITGVEFGTISGSLTKLTRSLGDAEGGNKKTAAAFAELGVSTVDANGNLRDSTAVYSDVIAALGQVSNPTERDVLAMQLLGKSATELNPLIDGSAGSIADLAAQAHNAGAVLSGDMLNGLGNVDDAFDKLEAGVSAAKNALGLTLMPVLQELGDSGSGLLGEFTNALLDANGNLGQAAPAIGSVVGKAVEFILGEAPKLLQVGTSMVSSILAGIAKQGPSLITSAVPVIVGFATGILGQLPALLDAGIKMLVALVQGIADALPTLIPAAVDAVIGLVGALVDNLPMLIDAGIQLLLALEVGLIDALPKLIAALPSVITGIITALVGAIPKLVMAGVQLFVALVSNLPAIISGIISAIPVIMKSLFDAIGDPKFWKQMGDAGLQLIKGLWEGIKGAGDWLWNQVKGFFGGLLNQIKDFLGIHSPSTVFAGFGMNLVQGLAGGISGASGLASRAVSDLSSMVASGFGTTLDVQARASFAGSGGTANLIPKIDLTVNMLPEQDPRIVGRQIGREIARELAGVPA